MVDMVSGAASVHLLIWRPSSTRAPLSRDVNSMLVGCFSAVRDKPSRRSMCVAQIRTTRGCLGLRTCGPRVSRGATPHGETACSPASSSQWRSPQGWAVPGFFASVRGSLRPDPVPSDQQPFGGVGGRLLLWYRMCRGERCCVQGAPRRGTWTGLTTRHRIREPVAHELLGPVQSARGLARHTPASLVCVALQSLFLLSCILGLAIVDLLVSRASDTGEPESVCRLGSGRPFQLFRWKGPGTTQV
jgi:hypothetical protein